ncbi:MAG: IS3 family transposase [Lachnospiraceae bacterium]|nr:IS3 family transposase [Lachnospiraceae bacterium]
MSNLSETGTSKIANYRCIDKTLADPDNRLSIKELCCLAGVARSAYYHWHSRRCACADREGRDRADYQLILTAYRYRGYDKGVRGIYMRLLHMGIRMNKKKIRRLMHKYGLSCPVRKANPYRRMARAMRTNAVADNHVKREFKLHGARAVLLTDITYIPFQGDFVYLSVIIDAYTMQALSYELSQSLEIDFVLLTVQKLIDVHGTTLDHEVYIHSDQGCHYTSIRFRELIRDAGLRQSMSRRGNCWDNAPQESFFGHMKDELRTKKKSWKSFSDLQSAIDDWMDYYNNERYQEGLECLSPNEFYLYKTKGIYPVQIPDR